MTTLKPKLHAINEALINGDLDKLKTYIYLREIADLLGDIMKGCKDEAVQQLTKDGGKFEDESVTVFVTKGRGTWNYKNIPEWVKQKETLEKIEESGKEAYKAWEKGRTIIEEGVIIQPALYKESEDTLTFKFKKL